MYKVCANVNDVAIKKVLLTPSFEVNMTETLAALDANTKLL